MRTDDTESPTKNIPSYKDNYQKKDIDSSPMHLYSSKPNSYLGAMDWLAK